MVKNIAKNTVKDFRILLVYANTSMEPLMSLGIASIATALQMAGFNVKLFDTTFYKDEQNDSQMAREDSLQIKSVDYSQVGVRSINGDPVEDFKNAVRNFKPHLIGLSCVELTWPQGLKLLESVKKYKIPNVVGGCFATFSPEEVVSNDTVNMVCIGEGERAIVELARKMSLNEQIVDIPNLWIKKGDTIIRSKMGDLIELESLPISQFGIFAPERIYRAMAGKIYRMLPIEFSRGCPYKCTYCSAPSYAKKFSHVGRWLRFKSVGHIMDEIDFYIKEYNVEYFYFVSESFLAMPAEYKKEFYSSYKKYRIPFWFNTRPETINYNDIRCLEDVGCHRISIGIESGNEEFRRMVLKRNYSNENILKAVNIVLKSKIQLSVNNMIGFPDETREMVFDTIKLNREFKADNHSISIFQPFRGTELYDYCMSKGYWNPAKLCTESFATPALEMPTLTKDEIRGLYRTFNLYINAEMIFWNDIKKAEKFDEEGNRAFFELTQRFHSQSDIPAKDYTRKLHG